MTARLCAANASLSSIQSMSCWRMPVVFSSFGIAAIGPTPMISGGTPATAKPTNRASGTAPNSRMRALGHHDRCACAVGRLRAVPGSDRAARREHRPQLREPFSAGVGTRALVAIDARRPCADPVPVEVGDSSLHVERRDLVGELAARLRGQRLAMRLERERVLRLARHVPLLGHLLRRQPHPVGDADVLVAREHVRVHREPAEQRDHAHALGARGDHHVRFAGADPVGGDRHRVQSRRAEPVDRHAGHARRQPREQHADPRDVHALLELGHRAADDHVLDPVAAAATEPCAVTLRRTCASSVSGRVVRNTPRGALPTAVRVAATMYAS